MRIINGGVDGDPVNIENFTVNGHAATIGSPNGDTSKARNVDGTGAHFGVNALKAHNIRFENLTLNEAQAENSHLFDLAGCDKVTFERLHAQGYGPQKSGNNAVNTNALYASDPHNIYAEAIQLDYPYTDAFGKSAFDSPTNALFNTDNLDKNLPTGVPATGITTNVTVDGSEFTSSSAQPNSPTAIGSHTGTQAPAVTITNTTFRNTFYDAKHLDDKRLYPIHFRATNSSKIHMSNNSFPTPHGNPSSQGVSATYEAWYH